MLRTTALLALVIALPRARADEPTFASRVPYAPLVQKLADAGGTPAQILRPTRAADLDSLAPGKRYKFVVDRAGRLAIAPLPADAPRNEFVHPILGGGEPVRTAGGLRVERTGAHVTRVIVDEDSQSYCPSFASLAAAAAALLRLGVPATAIAREDRAPRCAGK
jgi:hypothetical protein